MAEDTEQTDDQVAEPKSKKKLFIIIGAALVLVLAIAGGAAMFFLSSDEEAADVATQETSIPEVEAIYTKIRTLEGKPMFVVSLESEGDEMHYMQLYVEAQSRNESVDAALQLHMPLIVARLNALFSSQNFNALIKVEAKRAMREQATATVQEILQDKIGEPGIESILFTNMVMQ